MLNPHFALSPMQREWNNLASLDIFSSNLRTTNSQPPSMPIKSEALLASLGQANVLPIEFFKQYPDELVETFEQSPVRTFLSSGTTQKDRSQSNFSEKGLAAYKHFSVKGFQSILRHFFPNARTAQGVSLIPSSQEWPSSSLAQMLGWIGENQPLHYLTEGEILDCSQPIWIFATAFHLINLADEGRPIKLHPASIVVETGGTKGRSRSVTRETLYSLIEANFGLARNRIVSEYGMCELASQAYDFVLDYNGPEQPLEHRWFQFPLWVETKVRDRLSRVQSKGEGSLQIHDLIRTDIPWPIRTEDMARLRGDGAFQLLGRVPFTPLKGCSMQVEEFQNSDFAADLKLPLAINKRIQDKDLTQLKTRARYVAEKCQALIDDPRWVVEWLKEFNSTQVVDWLRQDLRESLPSHIQNWCQAAEKATEVNCPHTWLIIPPQSHSLAWLQPLFLGAIAGLKLVLRADPHLNLIKLLKEILEPLQCLSIWPNSNRIGRDPLTGAEAILVYGSNATLALLARHTHLPMQGFGTFLSASIVDGKNLPEIADDLQKDAFSLMQRGCMASRLLFILNVEFNEVQFLKISQSLLAQNRNPVGPLELGTELALEHGGLEARCQAKIIRSRQMIGEPLYAWHKFNPKQSIEKWLEPRALSLSLIAVSADQLVIFSEWLEAEQDLKQLTIGLAERSMLKIGPRFRLALPGKGNVSAWDGTHEGRPLFASRLG